MFQLTFLGTSAGIPTKYRNVSGLAIECLNPYISGDTALNNNHRPWILVDCGEGTQHQILHTKLSILKLEAICITHAHGDHCYGLPGLLASMSISGRKKPLTLIAPKAISILIDAIMTTTQLHLSYAVNFIAIEEIIPTDSQSFPLQLSNTHRLDIEIVPLSHRIDSYAFAIAQSIEKLTLNIEKLKANNIPAGPTWGQLQQGKDVTQDDGTILSHKEYINTQKNRLKIVISGDNAKPEILADTTKDAMLFVHESTYTQVIADRIMSRNNGFDPEHSTAEQIARFSQKHQISNLILTHISARYQMFDDINSKVANMGHIRAEVEQYFDGNFWLAKDFDQFIVNEEGTRKI